LKAEERASKGLRGICTAPKPGADHFQVDGRILVPTETDETHLALFLRLLKRFGRAIRADEQIGVVLTGNAVNLPEAR
jgi:hypothetical protein